MKEYKNIQPENSKGQHHGYQEWYCPVNKTLSLRTQCKNGWEIGYLEWHIGNTYTEYYIK